MIFYKYSYTVDGQPLNNIQVKKERERGAVFSRVLEKEAIECSSFCENLKDIALYITDKGDDYIDIVCIYKGSLRDLCLLDIKVEELITFLNIDLIFHKKFELTLNGLLYELDIAQENNYINNAREVREKNDLYISGGLWFKEKKLSGDQPTKEEVIDKCKKLIVEEELIDEVERIYHPKQDNSFGVPVQYMINIYNDDECDSAVQVLINSLKSNGRIIREVYSVIDLTIKDKFGRVDPFDISKLYKMNLGGVVVIKANFKLQNDDIYSDERRITEIFADVIKRFSAEVTTIVCCKNPTQENVFKEGLTDLLLIQINDTAIKGERAKQYLLDYANSLNISNVTGLTQMVEDNISYKPNDLITLFTKWHKNYVKTIQYPQYAGLVVQEVKKCEQECKEQAYNELNNLIGLNSIKSTINDYINYAKLQKACEEAGSIVKNACRHMCFVGNPGTAKTTVARYVAQVLKEQGLLSKGELIEVGRADIVSRYIGGTAPNVKNLFEKAEGNVLFIDEAYSLCESRNGMYGDEAINAIVQEMENRRDDLVVIFAGYKAEMEQFLERNSGLRSRVAHIVEFPDYSTDELIDIANFQAEKMHMDISLCYNKIRELITIGKRQDKNFGNGRFIRSILEKARMKQASRLVAEDKLFGENLRLLKPVDFEIPKVEGRFTMGFC